jgi:hypothetical protein
MQARMRPQFDIIACHSLRPGASVCAIPSQRAGELALRSLNTSVSSVNGVAGLSRSPRARSNRGGGHTRLRSSGRGFLMLVERHANTHTHTHTQHEYSTPRYGWAGPTPSQLWRESVSFRTRNPFGCDARGAWYGTAPARNIRSSCRRFGRRGDVSDVSSLERLEPR